MSARIQDTFDLPVSDECGCSDARMVTQETDSASRPDGIGDVGAVRHSSSDAAREVAILHAGQEIEQAMDRYAESGCFTDRADADAARLRMEALIRGRSQEQVARLEQERGLRGR